MEYRSFLDKVRWIAALIVAFGHALAILNSETQGARWIEAVAAMRDGAVIVFFILSGYLVGGAVLKAGGDFDWHGYAVARFARIYAVLLPAIALTLVVDGAVYLLDPANPVYAATWQNGALGEGALWSRYNATQILGTVLAIEPFTGWPMGSALSLWSLGYEWIFYGLFPLVWVPISRRAGPRAGVVALVLSVVVMSQLPRLLGLLWFVWLAGAAAHALERKGVLAGRGAIPIRVVSAAVVLAYVIAGHGLPFALALPVVGIAGMLFLASGRQGEARLSGPLDAPLAGSSYSFYAIHLQLMAGMAALLLRLGILAPTGIADPVRVVVLALGMTVISAVVAYGFGRMFEARSPALARYLKSRLAGRPPLIAPPQVRRPA